MAHIMYWYRLCCIEHMQF